MVLGILDAAVNSAYFPKNYVQHIATAAASLVLVHAFSQGRTTNRDRDLHARTVLVTGGFTSLGLTLIQALAQRGAHVIALTSDPVESAEVTILIGLLRTSTSNENIYAEQCDLSSPSSIHAFCTRFMAGQDQRLDALLFAHEYQHLGSFGFLSPATAELQKERETRSLATFLLITLLLPALLVAPVERDIRIINIVNRFYAAAANKSFSVPFSYSVSTPPNPQNSIFLAEGTRALKTCILTRHIQRVLDALPSAQVPKTDVNSSSIPVIDAKTQKSNIVTVSVSPGISRVDTIAPLFHADWTGKFGRSYLGVVLYLLFQPIFRLIFKSPISAIQSVLHVLFIPTPFKIIPRAKQPKDNSDSVIENSVVEIPEEILKPGSLYAECAVVPLKMPTMDFPAPVKEQGSKGKAKAKAKPTEGVMELPDDGELGGESTGRAVWEAYEAAVKVWQEAEPKKPVKAGG
ncbi:uncharacterized protein BT62DRAFT_946346 [Guyanagaster necrorhizus]|uniref:Ketoreductase (KR) domain-containing protein n=1 Tax=Guyanagaster necrorhizus TaxID=856835 RepID=A0A9P7VY55_9AGAR|nr:uncharacterized protein BT62DRAFT_946346 [Guyanagaster necrorhizus MCA 3950]KAG7448722.1 hypothetical protein BT62DRAFT_946346 [Guyanagaster necrorhizus MCA 3950]